VPSDGRYYREFPISTLDKAVRGSPCPLHRW
jgi:hypothetical protein